jgi:hypothetical protein
LTKDTELSNLQVNGKISAFEDICIGIGASDDLCQVVEEILQIFLDNLWVGNLRQSAELANVNGLLIEPSLDIRLKVILLHPLTLESLL